MNVIVNFETDDIQVEHEIHPFMDKAVMIPLNVSINGKALKERLDLFICASQFAPRISDKQFQAVVDAVVEQLEAREG